MNQKAPDAVFGILIVSDLFGPHIDMPIALIEVVSKPQIAFESKASRELKTERTRKYVSISICGTTRLSDARWGFEITSNNYHGQEVLKNRGGRIMKLHIFAAWCVLSCSLVAVPPVVSASDNAEVYVVTLDSGHNTFYMGSLGEGQFTQQELIGLAGNPKDYSCGIGIGDFDNDGDLDYVVGSGKVSGSIYLFEKLGPGNDFDQPVTVGSWEGGVMPMDIAVADFNEDGNLDFILAKFASTDCELYTGDGRLGFTAAVIPDAAHSPSTGVDAADFNNDGHADFVVAPYMAHDGFMDFYVNLGRGDGTFEIQIIEVETYQATTYWGVAAGDFNGDGKADFVATGVIQTNAGTIGIIDIYRGLGDGAFDLLRRIENGGVTDRSAVDNYDFNGDRKQDLVIGGYGRPNIAGVGVFLGDGEGDFVYSSTYSGGSFSNRYAISAPPYVQNNKSPIAVVDPAYQEITAGETVFFNGEGSYDEDGEIVDYIWDFGDQSFSRKQALDQGFSAQHVYHAEGLYTITLTVTDDRGATHSVGAQVRVNPLAVKIKFTPQILNPGSRGKWVQAIIWLPNGYDASQIDRSSLCIVENQTPLVYAVSSHQGHKFSKFFRKKGVRMLIVKFDRQALLAGLSGPAGVKTLQVQGRLQVGGTLSQANPESISFKGSGTIRTIESCKKHKPDKRNKKHDD